MKFIPSVFCVLALLSCLTCIWGCSDFWHPVKSTDAPTEYTFNYWLLNRTYLFEDELSRLEEVGDSVQLLYKKLDDPFTRYVEPSKSEDASVSINTSIVQGDIGLEYYLNSSSEYPVCIQRVYPESPADRAGVKRYGCIVSINGFDLKEGDSLSSGDQVLSFYKSILSRNKNIELNVIYPEGVISHTMEKENVYAPTVFIDTVYGFTVITVSAFKETTFNRTQGTYGELKAYLDSTKGADEVRILDLRGNPGGHVSQCVSAADLFIKAGTISSRYWRTFNARGEPIKRSLTVWAKAGDGGEDDRFIVLINRGSASCAEIFTAAISEGAGIPVVGITSYGKGIGQTTWNTVDKGLAIITNLEFLTPKGNSYHKKGITPDAVCESGATIKCGVEFIQNKYGTGTGLKKKNAMDKDRSEIDLQSIRRIQDFIGGAYLPNEDPYLTFTHFNENF